MTEQQIERLLDQLMHINTTLALIMCSIFIATAMVFVYYMQKSVEEKKKNERSKSKKNIS